MPERRRSATTAERLGRMLVIVPYLVQHAGTGLAYAAEKLRDALGSDTFGDAAGIEGAVTSSAPAHLDALRAAAADLRRIRIDYTAASTGERSVREVEPEAVFASAGHWYVVAWDVAADGERLFRADRVSAVEETGGGFGPRGLEAV